MQLIQGRPYSTITPNLCNSLPYSERPRDVGDAVVAVQLIQDSHDCLTAQPNEV
jgi:hypothetical protein